MSFEHVYRIFGRDPAGEALERARRGDTKDAIFRETGHVVAVRDAGLEVEEGEIIVVMGLSGCGKSTLVRMVNGLMPPTDGVVRVEGEDVAALSRKALTALRRERVSMVFQSFALMPHLTNLENAAFGLGIAGVREPRRSERAGAALESVGLGDHADGRPQELSGGMRQRVGLARALAVDPALMVMDEAFSALDPLIRTEMQEELLRIQRERELTVLFVSHDVHEALRIGDRIAVMAEGRIVQVGTPEEILQQPADDYVREFFQDVSPAEVLTAGDIMRRDPCKLALRPNVGVGVAERLLRDRGVDFVYALDPGGRYQGVVSAEALARARGRHEPLETLVDDSVCAVNLATPIGELYGRAAEGPCPIPVVDAAGRLKGIITKSDVLIRLAGTGAA
ncbi:MAG: quaternary amine ABC transporter ATP-binding protein [Pseudomonadota bacterium]